MAHYFRPVFGDTTRTKVFVGGLAWETTSEELHRHFARYGDILEAVVIVDRASGRSKGYGFVTFREPEAASRAVVDPNPVIGGRRANCNIAAERPPRPSPQDRARFRPNAPIYQPPNPLAPPYTRMPMQMQHQLYYPYGYWPYPGDYAYQQMAQQWYNQMYGQPSPSTAPPYPFQGAYMPYLRTGPPQSQQPSPQNPFLRQQSPAEVQLEGHFPLGPALPQNFRLQLPPHARQQQEPDQTAAENHLPTKQPSNADSEDT